MTCVILQPSYIPWRGYFHQIQKADFFVFYDDVQYDRRGWRNRNQIKTPWGPQWLTVPVKNKGNYHSAIQEIEIDWERPWTRKHELTIHQAYQRAPYYNQWAHFLKDIYCQTPTHLAPFTMDLTVELARRLGISHTSFLRSSELSVPGYRTERLVALVRHLGCDKYVTGPSAKAYLEEYRFAEAGITLEYMAYEYQEYPQLYPPFVPNVSVLDLLLMTGPEASKYIWR